ncbi:MAG: hypothetical protein ABI119_06975 [Gemmatimonadaceae bacterium]
MNDNTAYWRRAHRDWKFWVGVVFIVVAMVIFVMSENLLFRPSVQLQAAPISRR